MGTAQASGVVMLAAERAGLALNLYTPSEVKAAVTGDGRAAKSQVGFMVARILGLAEAPKPADAADALAIAITHGWRGKAQGASTAAQERWAAAESKAKAAASRRR
jgi:crossover junction endodeoxyribonuclease RuvC